MQAGDTSRTVVGGSFGLASKEFTPAMAYSVFENLKQATPKVYTAQVWLLALSMQDGSRLCLLVFCVTEPLCGRYCG